MTPAGRRLWNAIRNRRFLGLMARRQGAVGPHIAAFHCVEHRQIIEACGGGHGGHRDTSRDQWLCALGFRTIHLWTSDILADLPAALGRIAVAAQPD
jgi:very-short-patch-repair endonuclease